MVAVTDEVDLADPQQIDRRQRLAPAHGCGDVLPARPHPARGGAEPAVEIPAAIDRPYDRVQRHHRQPGRMLAHVAEGVDHLLVGQDHPDVVGLASQARGKARDGGLVPRPDEVALRVHARQAGGAAVARHRRRG